VFRLYNYTLSYYSTDIFGNIEEVKRTNFTLIERPETYAWNISWYVYDDSNRNWVEDEWEKFMAGWKICIDINLDWKCQESIEPFNLTNNKWYYEFNSLITWNYSILEIHHQNWEVTNNSWNYDISLSNWEKIINKSFWNFKVKENNKK